MGLQTAIDTQRGARVERFSAEGVGARWALATAGRDAEAMQLWPCGVPAWERSDYQSTTHAKAEHPTHARSARGE